MTIKIKPDNIEHILRESNLLRADATQKDIESCALHIGDLVNAVLPVLAKNCAEAKSRDEIAAEIKKQIGVDIDNVIYSLTELRKGFQ